METSTSRVPSLDGLRAFSILCVLWGHAAGTAGFPIRWSLDGALGVHIFFVISGFIITLLLLQEEQNRGAISLTGFYLRRAVRILPAYWVYLSVVALLGWRGAFPFSFAGNILPSLTFTMGFGFWRAPVIWQTAHTWSLAIEEQFYLVWPPMLVLLGRRWRLLAAALVAGLGPAGRWWIYQHPQQWGLIWTIVGNADMLGWGCALAIVREDYPDLLAKVVAWRPWLARLACVAVIEFAPWYFWKSFVRKYPPFSTNVLAYSAQAAAVAFLIASLTQVRRGILYRMLNLLWVAGIGVLSYSLYLWQELFLARPTHPPMWNRWPANLLCAVAAALASYFLIERPIRSAFRNRTRLTRMPMPNDNSLAEK